MTGGGLAHAGYIRAVAAALEAAGVPVADWRADGGVPRDGWIPFDLARQVLLHGRVVWDHDSAGAGWSEDHGWYLLGIDDPAGRDVRTVRVLEIPLLAAPRVVARAVAAVAGLPGPLADASAADPASPIPTGPVASAAAVPEASAATDSGASDAVGPGTATDSGASFTARPGASAAAGSGAGVFDEPGFAGRRAGIADPAFEAALLEYSPSRTKSVDGPGTAAQGRG